MEEFFEMPSKRTILVVDDEKEMRDRYRAALEKENFRVIEAPDALETANLLMRDSSSIDLILLDINIEEIDGRDIFDIIDQYDPTLQVMVSSVHPINDQKLKIPRAAEYHNKADGEKILLKKVKHILGMN